MIICNARRHIFHFSFNYYNAYLSWHYFCRLTETFQSTRIVKKFAGSYATQNGKNFNLSRFRKDRYLGNLIARTIVKLLPYHYVRRVCESRVTKKIAYMLRNINSPPYYLLLFAIIVSETPSTCFMAP